MSKLLVLLVITYPNGWFGTGPASASDAGMMLEQGVFAVEYNPSGLAWLDSLEVGVAAEGLFRYNLVGVAYKYQDWPLALSLHKDIHDWGFSLGAGYLTPPLAMGGGFSASFDTLGHDQTFSLRFGLQWREYVGLSLGPELWNAQDTGHLSVMVQVGVAVPIPIPQVEGLDFLAGAAGEIGPPYFRIGGGLAYEPFEGIKVQTVVTTEEWGAGLLLDNVDDRGGLWVRKGFGEETWRFGIAYVRNVHLQKTREVIVYRNLPGRVDTVYLTEAEFVDEDTTTRVISPEARKKQERLMAKANRYYAAQRYEDAIAAWREVIELDPSNDLAVRAREDIKEVTALIETLERIRSGRGRTRSKPQ